MKKRKKILALTLSCTMIAMSFMGCGSKEGDVPEASGGENVEGETAEGGAAVDATDVSDTSTSGEK